MTLKDQYRVSDLTPERDSSFLFFSLARSRASCPLDDTIEKFANQRIEVSARWLGRSARRGVARHGNDCYNVIGVHVLPFAIDVARSVAAKTIFILYCRPISTFF